MANRITIDLEKLEKRLIAERYLILVSLRPVAPAKAAYMRTVQAIVDTLREVPGFDEEMFLAKVRLEV